MKKFGLKISINCSFNMHDQCCACFPTISQQYGTNKRKKKYKTVFCKTTCQFKLMKNY